MIEQNLARLNKLLEKQIINLQSNNLLLTDDKVGLSVIIMHLTAAIGNLRYALREDEGEDWRAGDN